VFVCICLIVLMLARSRHTYSSIFRGKAYFEVLPFSWSELSPMVVEGQRQLVMGFHVNSVFTVTNSDSCARLGGWACQQCLQQWRSPLDYSPLLFRRSVDYLGGVQVRMWTIQCISHASTSNAYSMY
jgi:hypothetical protein